MEAYAGLLSAPCTTMRRIKTNPKKTHPELPENLTVWKSDNQGFKEGLFIPTGRRGGRGGTATDMMWCGGSKVVVTRQ